jgi:adenylate cyclase
VVAPFVKALESKKSSEIALRLNSYKAAAMHKKYSFLLIPVIVTLLCALLFFTTVDNTIFDLFLRAIPSLTEDESILLITIDDDSINYAGVFPWTRNLYADATIFLREMGADAVVFDLSFLDPSAAKVDLEYLRGDLPRYLDSGFVQINDNAASYIDAFASGGLKAPDAEDAKNAIALANESIKNQLGVSINYVARDMDAYLAEALKFFGNSYLTLTMVSEEDIIGEEKVYKMDQDILSWLKKNTALKNLTVKGDTRTPAMTGIWPALQPLLVNAGGAGFVNAQVDPDGYRRRVHLLLKHEDEYYRHLILAGLAKKLGDPDIEVNNETITLKNVRLGEKLKDIGIPRAEDGTVLLKWPKKQFSEYNVLSILNLIMYPDIERDFAENLRTMEQSGFFGYWEQDETPLDIYNQANYLKEALYQGEDSGQGVTFGLFTQYRQAYLEAAGKWLSGAYEEAIRADAADDAELEEYVAGLFDICGKQFQKLMEIREETEKLTRGRVCVVGVDATSMTDLGLITFQERYPNVGTYAVLANMILSEEFLDDAPRYISFVIALVFSLVLALVIKKLDTGKSIASGLGAIFLTTALFLLYFVLTRHYLGLAVPLTAVTLTFLCLTGLNFFSTVREKTFIRSAFSRYLAPAVIDQIVADPSRLKLGGQNLVMTAIFTDVRGFSAISEKLSAPALVELLNLYLTEMSNIVLENKGTIDKYEGDAIIAFFGAPVVYPDHAAQACRSAIRMKKAEREFNRRLTEKPVLPEELSPRFRESYEGGMDWHSLIGDIFTRIGINSGDMVVGNMGTPSKMDYTIMGNAVNLAARLEGVNKQYNTGGILLSEYTREMMDDEFVLRSLDRVRVVGINTPLRIFELLALRSEAPPELLAMTEKWEKAIGLFEKTGFDGALEVFSEISAQNPQDLTAKLYISRCENYRTHPPKPGWDGVNNLTEK